MRHRLALALLVAAFALPGCSSDAGDDGSDAAADRDTNRPDRDTGLASDSVGGADSTAADTDAPPRFVTLRIEPPVLELATDLGVAVTGSVTAIGVAPDGTELDLTTEVLWTTESSARARIAADGTVTAPGMLSGHVLIHADLDGRQAEGEVVVRIANLVIAPDVTPEEIAVFSGGADSPAPVAPTWLYPEHETVYPAGLRPPLLQWSHASDPVFHLRIEVSDHALLDVFTRARTYDLDPVQWALLSSDFGSPLVMTLESTSGVDGTVNRASPHTLHTADANLEGAVYYWQIATGDIMEIPHDADEARPLFSDNATNGNCRGCHAITRDGGRIGFMYNGGDNPRAGLAWVGAPEPPVLPNGTEFQWDSLSFEPAGLRAAAAHGGDMWLADTTPDLGGGIANLGPIPGINDGGRRSTHPAWSPDGTLLAWIARDDGVDWSFTGGDLWVSPWDAATGVFAAPRVLVARGAGDQDTVSYPTWSPDARWLAFSRGPDNRGEPPAHLFIADPLTGDATRLARGAPNGQDVLPAFSPFREGGYYWLLFYSRRPYGAVTTNKQLWVMAIDERHVTGTDPSHPAFWLPGQNPAQTNITGYWARVGCAREGNECKSADDCCVGLQCIDTEGFGTGTCQRVDCVLPARPCTESDVCCPGYECASSLVGTTVCIEAFR